MISKYEGLRNEIAHQPGVRMEFRAQHPGWNYRSIGACVGLGGGVIAGLLGSLLTAITWFTGTGVGSSYIHASGTVLLCVTIPLLIFGAHFLDLEEKRVKDFRFTRKVTN